MVSLGEGLIVTGQAYRDIVNECLRPECCERVGVLVGRNGRVEQAVALHNHETRRHAFAIDPDQIAAIAQDIQDTGSRLLGRFHTHWTGRLTPSLRDLASLPEGWAEMIVCLRSHGAQPDITSMRLFDGRGLGLPLRFETGEGPR